MQICEYLSASAACQDVANRIRATHLLARAHARSTRTAPTEHRENLQNANPESEIKINCPGAFLRVSLCVQRDVKIKSDSLSRLHLALRLCTLAASTCTRTYIRRSTPDCWLCSHLVFRRRAPYDRFLAVRERQREPSVAGPFPFRTDAHTSNYDKSNTHHCLFLYIHIF